MPKRILVLTYYYPPDLCAGSFRAGAFVDAMHVRHGDDIEIEVLTTMPNRYSSFRRAAKSTESEAGLVVHRLHVPAHKSGFLDQSLCFLRYSWQVLWKIRNREYDLVFATSSRLMTAALGAWASQRKKAPLYLDIRDLFVDTIGEVMGGRSRWLILPVVKALEQYTFRSASAINVVSAGFKPYFDAKGLGRLLRFFTNGIDAEFLEYDFSSDRSTVERPVILYAGNIGQGQGLHCLIPDAARLLSKTHIFRVIGDGGAKDALVNSCAGIENVYIEPPLDREALKARYADADILMMHLNDYDAFRKVLPSKIFEYAATGKPILAGVAGYAADFVRENVDNSAVFRPCDANELVAALDSIKIESVARDEFKSDYARTGIMVRLAVDVVQTLDNLTAPASHPA